MTWPTILHSMPLLQVSHLASWGENSLHYWLKCQCNRWQNSVFQIQTVIEFTTFWARITKLKLRNQPGGRLGNILCVCRSLTSNYCQFLKACPPWKNKYLPKCPKKPDWLYQVWLRMWRKWNSHTCWNRKRYNHFGKELGSFLKSWTYIYQMIPPFHL